MATIYVKGAPVVFTVTGIGAPTVGDTYTNNGGTFTIIATSLVAGAGTITCTIPTNTAPALSSSLVKATGAGNTVTSGNWSYTCASDTHYKELPASYTTGDTVEISNYINGFVRLIVDGEDSADVAAIENEKPLSITCPGVTGELLFTNASTTYPLIIPLSTTSSSAIIRATGYAAKMKVRGDWIEIYTSDGTRGQSFNLNFPTLNGAQIDNPPYFMAEADAGAGALISTTPTAGATYTNNSSTFTVVSASVTDGEGEMICTRTSGSNEPQEQGILTKATGTGDSVVGFRCVNIEGTSNYRFIIGNAWMPIMNIGGPYSNRANTAYTAGAYGSLSEYGQTYNLGHVFEYDEYNGGAAYGKVYLGKANQWTFGTGATGTTLPTVGATYTNNGQTFTVLASVETGSGSTRTRLISCSGTGAPTTSGTLTKSAGTGDATITFVDAVATGGWVPPNGAKIKMPNIHFTTAGYAGTTVGSRAIWGTNTYQHSTIDGEVFSLSDRFTLSGSSWGFVYDLRLRDFGYFGLAYASATLATGDIDILGLYNAPDKWVGASGGFTVPRCLGTVSVDRIYVVAVGSISAPFGFQTNSFNITKIGELRCNVSRRLQSSYNAVSLNELRIPANAPITAGPIYSVGHKTRIDDCRNLRVYDIRHSDSPSGAYSLLASTYCLNFGNQCENVIVEKITRLPSGAPFSSYLIQFDGTNKNSIVHSITYDGLLTGATASKSAGGLVNGTDMRTFVTDVTVTNFTGSLYNGSNLGQYPVRFLNLFSDYATSITSDMRGGLHASVFGCNSPSTSFSYTTDNGHMLTTYSGGTRDVGQLIYAPASKSTSGSGIFEAITGTEGADYSFVGATALQCPGIVELRSHTILPLYGIRASASAFTSATLAITGTSSSTLTFACRLCKWGDDITAVSFQDVTSQANARTNLQAMLDTAISAGYTPEIGLNVEFKITSAAAVGGRYLTAYTLSAVQMATTFTSPDKGSIEVEYTGVTSGSSVALVDNDVVTHYTASSTGEETYEVPYDYTGTSSDLRISKPKVFTLVARKAGYAESILDDQECYQGGTSLPMALSLDYATTDSDIDATHLVINGSAKTFAVSASHTLLELYQRAQWWAHQEANMNYDTPLTTKSGTSFTQPTLWTLSGVSNLTGGGTVSQGTIVLDGPATYTTGWNGCTIVAQGEGTYGLTATSSIITFAPTANAVTYSLGGGSFSGTIDLRNTHATRTITVELPAGTSYTTANNTGASITVSIPSVDTGITFSGVVDGSQVKVFETGTTTELYSSTSAPYEWSETYSADQDVDYTIMKVGYRPIRVTGVTAGNTVQTATISQTVDRAYSASSGLTYGTTATVNTGTKQVTVTTDTTVQNWYSFMIESWIAQSALKNTAFPFSTNGPNSFTLENGWVWGDGATSIAHLSRDGMRYLNTSGNVVAMWCAVLTSGTASGLQVKFQQTHNGPTQSADNTGVMDQLVQIVSDPNGDGNYADGYDYRNWLVLKIQKDGYDQAEADIYATFGSLEDQLYVAGLNPVSNGLATGDPSVTGVTITDHGASPVTWNGKAYSITITDSAGGHTGTELMRWLRYNYGLGGAFQSKDAFDWHDLIQTNGSKYKTVRGAIYGDTGATLKGVRVVQNDGSTAHNDFNLFTADDGTTYVPPIYQSVTISGLTANSRVQLYDTTNSVERYNAIVTGTSFTWTDTTDAVTRGSCAIRARISFVDGVTAMSFVEVNLGTLGTVDGDESISYTASQTADTVYEANGVNGSTVNTPSTIITINDGLLLVEVDTGSISLPTIYAYESYWLYDEEGIRDESRFITAVDTANYRFADFKIKNVSSPTSPLVITGGYAVDNTTGDAIDIIDTTGGTIFLTPNHVVPYAAGAEATVAVVQAGLTAQGLTTTRAGKIDQLDKTLKTAKFLALK